MSLVVPTGTRVCPGELLYAPPNHSAADFTAEADHGCARVGPGIRSTRLGVVQWTGHSVAVFASTRGGAVIAPRSGDAVLLRVNRLTRGAAFGEIIAVNGEWCSAAVAFRGALRAEDIRPFRPAREGETAPTPADAFGAGDVVRAEVLSQSDARHYQLSTTPTDCGAVDAVGERGARLQHIPGRRDAMRNPTDGSVCPRWCPLIRLP